MASPQPLAWPPRARPISRKLVFGDRVAMHFVWTVGKAQCPSLRVEERKLEVIADAGSAVDLHRPIDHLACHARRRNLDHRDLLLRGLVTGGIHFPGRMEHEQAYLIDQDAGVGDPLLRDGLLRQCAPERNAAAGTPAHRFERALGEADETHAVMDPPRPEASLRDLEPAAFPEENV